MTTIQAQVFGNSALLPRPDLERLLELARRTEEVEVKIQEDDLPTVAMMRLSDTGGAFDFWNDDREDIYSADDGKLCAGD